MANQSDYQPLAQDDEAEQSEALLPGPVTRRGGRPRRNSRPGHIDLSKLDNAFKRWTDSIAQKVKRKKKVDPTNEKLEIVHSVLEPTVPPNPHSAWQTKTLDHKPPMTKEDFNNVVQSVRQAIAEGIQPKLITKGSSGSYFARAKVDGKVQTVAVFKPKDEEPYGQLNPKTTKWLHRQLRWIIPFGRACLIPNLSYISEAAASLLDERLELYMVPRTELVSLSSPAFFYDWIDRTAAKNGKRLPDKIGSMQYFMHGYQDASDFLRKHPWPGRAIADTFDDSNHRTGNVSKRFMSTMNILCGKTGNEDDMYDETDDDRMLYDATEDADGNRPFYWSEALQQSFTEELEKLVILDYMMRNTDRGADNYMIKYCSADHEKSQAESKSYRGMPQMSELRGDDSQVNTPTQPGRIPAMSVSGLPVASGSRLDANGTDRIGKPHMHIAAIDNSLSFPHEHPKGWRSYTYGWLFLPVSIVGRPFSQKTRDHFLPLLTSKTWWEETTWELRKLFAVDPDFHPKMFRRQLAVMKGQAYNIIQSLRHADEGPLELTRRDKVLVWDDEIEVPEDSVQVSALGPDSPVVSIRTMPMPRHGRSSSAGASDFPPPMRRTSTELSRPTPFSTKFQRVHPATTGVTVLEHMERLDKVEASLKRLGSIDGSVIDEDEEGDVGVASSSVRSKRVGVSGTPLMSPGTTPLPVVQELHEGPSVPAALIEVDEPVEDDDDNHLDEPTEEDVAALSKSMSQIETSPSRLHTRWGSDAAPEGRPSLDWMLQGESDGVRKRIAIAERLEPVLSEPLLSCW